MKKLLTILGSASAVVAAPLSTVAMTTEKNEVNKDDASNPSIELNESEITEIQDSKLGVHLNKIRKSISVENIDNIKQIISNSSFSERIKSYLYKRVGIQLNLNEMFNKKNATSSHGRVKRSGSTGVPTNFMDFDHFITSAKSNALNVDIPSIKTYEPKKPENNGGIGHHWIDLDSLTVHHPSVIPNANEEITIENAFNPANYIERDKITDAAGNTVKYNNGQILYMSGEDSTIEDHHLFDDDITIFNVSNQSVWKKAEVFTHLQMSQTKEAQELRKNAEYTKGLLKNIGVVDNSLDSLEIAENQFEKAIDVFFKKIEDSPMYKYIKHFLWFKSIYKFKKAFIARQNNGMSLWDNLLLTSGETGLISAAFAGAATWLGGPVAGEIVGTLVDAFLNVEVGNGATILSNMADHGLNDWKFQWNNNAEVMSKIEFEFSEGCLHGVSWKVKDTIWRTPDLWIRPGQTTDAPWVKLSTDVYMDGRMRKQFVWGRPVRFRNYDGTASLKRKLDSLSRTHFEKVAYEDTVEVGIDPWLNLETGGVEYSGSHRYFHVSAEYGSTPIAASPSKFMHEDDHDDDNVEKGWNWKAEWPKDSIELSVDDIMNGRIDKGFQMRFGDGRVRAFQELDTHMKLIQRKVLEYARFVQKLGMYPIYATKPNGIKYIQEYRRFDPTKIIVPSFSLDYVRFDRIKFNTYDDPGYDDTHSDHFRFGGVKIAIHVKFGELDRDEI